MKVVWSRRAIQHLIALRQYITKHSEQNAALVAKRLPDSVDLLQTQPEMGRPGRVLGTRELVVSATPYLIPYRVRRDRLELIAIFHGHQKWPTRLEEIRDGAKSNPMTLSCTSPLPPRRALELPGALSCPASQACQAPSRSRTALGKPA